MAAALGVVLGLLGFYGIGQLYLERVARGLFILFGDWAVGFLGIVFVVLALASPGFLLLAAVCFLASFILFIWQIIDATNLAKEWNHHVERTGQKPW